MAGNEIKIVIGGDASSLVQASNQSAASVDALQKTIVAASAKIDTATDAIRHSFDEVAASKAAMDRISAAIDTAATAATSAGPKFDSLGGRLPLEDFNKFRASVEKLKKEMASGFKPVLINPNAIPPTIPPALDKVSAKSKTAGAAILDFSRIVQDAPFAVNNFGSIANNIDPAFQSLSRLTEEAKRLSLETGKNVTAFSLLGQSLLGGAGIGLLISLITSGITAFQMFRSKAEESSQATKDFNAAVNGAFESTAKEATQAGILVSVLRNETETRERKLGAIKELQSISPEIFKNLKLEGDAVVGLDKSYKDFVDNLKNVVAIRIQQAKLEQLIEKQLKKQGANLTGIDKLGTLASTKESLEKLKELQSNGGIVDPNQIKLLEGIVGRTEKELGGLNKEIDEILKNIESLSKGVKINTDNKKEEDALKQRIEALKELQSLTGLDAGQQVQLAQLEIQLINRDFAKLGFTKAEAQQKIQGILEKAFPVGTFEFDTVVTTRVNKLEPSKIQNPEPLSEGQKIDIAKAIGLETIEIPAPNLVFLNLQDKSKAALEQLNKSITDASAGAVDSFAEGIGNAIVGKGDIFSSLFNIMADGLIQIGKALLAYGLALVGFKVALKSLNPIVAIAAGAGAIIAGAALKASIPKFADGGIATRSTLGIFGEAGKEAIIPLDRLPELLGRINVNNQSDVALAPTFRVSLTDLELGLERVRSSRRRLG